MQTFYFLPHSTETYFSKERNINSMKGFTAVWRWSFAHHYNNKHVEIFIFPQYFSILAPHFIIIDVKNTLYSRWHSMNWWIKVQSPPLFESKCSNKKRNTFKDIVCCCFWKPTAKVEKLKCFNMGNSEYH